LLEDLKEDGRISCETRNGPYTPVQNKGKAMVKYLSLKCLLTVATQVSVQSVYLDLTVLDTMRSGVGPSLELRKDCAACTGYNMALFTACYPSSFQQIAATTTPLYVSILLKPLLTRNQDTRYKITACG
jgi:hypothetical protein